VRLESGILNEATSNLGYPLWRIARAVAEVPSDLSLRKQVESARLGAPSTGPRSRDGVRSCEGS